MQSSKRIVPTYLILLGLCLVVVLGCGRKPVIPATDEPKSKLSFDLFWPPQDLDRLTNGSGEPLLAGQLSIYEQLKQSDNKKSDNKQSDNKKSDNKQSKDKQSKDNPDAFYLNVTLTRGGSEADRERWNKELAFPEYTWMSRVRVWDLEGKWIWPNLPYLLRAHGEARIERYGGVDPTKGVDNDFAAVLIRPLDDQFALPLVSAEWHDGKFRGAAENATDKHSVVHVAASDDFVVNIPSDPSTSGTLGVWLIYADIMEASMPRTWPSEGEYSGGILAYFEVQWSRNSNGDLEFTVSQLTPKSATGFDWKQWSTGSSPLKTNLRLE